MHGKGKMFRVVPGDFRISCYGPKEGDKGKVSVQFQRKFEGSMERCMSETTRETGNRKILRGRRPALADVVQDRIDMSGP